MEVVVSARKCRLGKQNLDLDLVHILWELRGGAIGIACGGTCGGMTLAGAETEEDCVGLVHGVSGVDL